MSFVFPFSPHLRKPTTPYFLQQSNPVPNPRGSQVNPWQMQLVDRIHWKCEYWSEMTPPSSLCPSVRGGGGWQHSQLILTPWGFGDRWLWLPRIPQLPCYTLALAAEDVVALLSHLWLCWGHQNVSPRAGGSAQRGGQSQGWAVSWGRATVLSAGRCVLRCCFVLCRFYC